MAGKVRLLYDGRVGCSADGRATLKEPCTPGPCTCPYGTAAISVTFSGIALDTTCDGFWTHEHSVVTVSGDINSTFLLMPRTEDNYQCCFYADTGIPASYEHWTWIPDDPMQGPDPGHAEYVDTYTGTIFVAISFTQLEDSLGHPLHRLLMGMQLDIYEPSDRCLVWEPPGEQCRDNLLFFDSWPGALPAPSEWIPIECSRDHVVIGRPCPTLYMAMGYGGQAIITPLSAGGI